MFLLHFLEKYLLEPLPKKMLEIFFPNMVVVEHVEMSHDGLVWEIPPVSNRQKNQLEFSQMRQNPPGLLDVDLPWRCLASATRTDSSTMAMRVGLDCHVGYLDHPRTCG